jgi:hypothetical protein
VIAAVRLFMTAEAVTFLLAASIHRGFLISGYQHQAAATGESLIAFVLFIALLLTWIRPGSTRLFGLLGQGFAFLGTLVGVFTIAIGVGPRTLPDVTYHALILAVLAWGLVMTYRAGPRRESHVVQADS